MGNNYNHILIGSLFSISLLTYGCTEKIDLTFGEMTSGFIREIKVCEERYKEFSNDFSENALNFTIANNSPECEDKAKDYLKCLDEKKCMDLTFEKLPCTREMKNLYKCSTGSTDEELNKNDGEQCSTYVECKSNVCYGSNKFAKCVNANLYNAFKEDDKKADQCMAGISQGIVGYISYSNKFIPGTVCTAEEARLYRCRANLSCFDRYDDKMYDEDMEAFNLSLWKNSWYYEYDTAIYRSCQIEYDTYFNCIERLPSDYHGDANTKRVICDKDGILLDQCYNYIQQNNISQIDLDFYDCVFSNKRIIEASNGDASTICEVNYKKKQVEFYRESIEKSKDHIYQ